jgi:hypothetical protein
VELAVTGKNKNPLLGWHPPSELGEWARAEAKRRGGKGELSKLLTEALSLFRRTQTEKDER